MSEAENKLLIQEVVDRLTYNGEEFRQALNEFLEAHPKKYEPEYNLGKIGETIREQRTGDDIPACGILG